MEQDWEYDGKRIKSKVITTTFTDQELQALQKAVQQVAEKVKRKIEKYRDIHESGDATEAQQTKLHEALEEYGLYDAFLRLK